MTSAAIYVRASTEVQNYSADNQVHALKQYAADHGLQIIRIYSDDGKSGLDLKGRPGLRQLLADTMAPDRGFEVLLVYDISRWGRFQDPDESAHYEFLCRRAGLRVVYCAEPFDNDGSPIANLLKAIKREMAGEYSRALSTKVAQGKRRLAERGFRQGGPRGLGFERLLVDANGRAKGILARGERKSVQSDRVLCIPGPAHERALVRRIFRLFTNEGLGETAIAAHLNAEDVPSPSGGRWSNGAVRYVLTDERYIGVLTYGRLTTRLKTGKRPVPAAQWVRVPSADLPPTVSRRTFAKAQEVLRTRRGGGTDAELLTGLKRLWREAGTITQDLIRADKRIPCVTVYQHRFGTLYEAYRRIGFQPKRTIRGMPVSRYGTDAQILTKLSALLVATGYLTGDLINAAPELPSVPWLERRFGSLSAAYSRIGYVAPRTWRGRPRSASGATSRPPAS